MAARPIFTIGHSTRTIDALVQILVANNVGVVADVRSFPRSYRNLQFNIDLIVIELAKRRIRYVWLPKLGGRRKGLGKESKNTCWRNTSFRNYANYMETRLFLEGAEELIGLASNETVAIMCAEAVYWRCHRSMISDFLKSRGIQVTHILGEKQTREHDYNHCAKITNGNLKR